MRPPHSIFHIPHSRGGFTLIEVLVVTAILVVILGFAAASGADLYGNQVLVAERDSLVGLLRDARSMAMNNLYESSHGVYIGAGQYVSFSGLSYAQRNQIYDTTFPMSYGISLTGPAEIVFNALDGASNVSGTITISSSKGSANVSVNNEGRIDW